ncbi:MAG: leader peptidase (prepilin peptidase) / N-methyltransferase, partial [Microbacteriaceae bacterium]|nr:leader peptidase (prepilin peptidase) / N-methyltransferase [Microbacteriaceae bacterium]
MILLALAVIGCVGLGVGSFLTVVAHRVPVGLSLAGSLSACPQCGTTLAVRDSLPLVSWALLRGACRYCRRPIPARYPLVEA